jgi:hypothetical protein
MQLQLKVGKGAVLAWAPLSRRLNKYVLLLSAQQQKQLPKRNHHITPNHKTLLFLIEATS